MRKIKPDPSLVSCCGIFCGACGSYLNEKCGGCHQTESRSWCKVRECCNKKGISTCAQCNEFADPNACGKFNNLISKVVGFFTKSDRPACLKQIHETGLEAYAVKMAALKMRAIRRTG